ncbi:15-hydroxyprostaglandin dehydrogenase [NAD(+)]-like [Ostrinia furnacalis]|uniref:15-hydroxyprostaglandin dehydrogenase [NAD(+)]-like n=1 Tax=Ostrinia furnacalis TaxID=93504 RepID=UPI00103A9F41|nr:15-hydroxyprostaglandin dehydrogenase [NAD(+)]-like [Ostrinia furnacalis]
MVNDLKNKTVVITGGAQGIGLATADKYLAKGAKVCILVDIDAKHGATAVNDLNGKYGNNRAEFIKCDVTADLEAVSSKIFNKYKTVDVLINNAGILNEHNLRKTIEINVTALMEWSVKFFDHMRKDNGGKGGTIINLASIYGFRVDPFLPIYQGSKFAVMGYTRSLGHKYRCERYGVRVVAVCPGFTDTILTTGVKVREDQIMQKDFEKMLEATPWQQVEDVARAAVDVYEKAESGTAWLIEGSKPIVEV